MRSPVSVKKQVALTLYYLSDEGRLWKVAKSCSGLSRACVSFVIRRVTHAITGPEYIQLPITEADIKERVTKLFNAYSVPQCIGCCGWNPY